MGGRTSSSGMKSEAKSSSAIVNDVNASERAVDILSRASSMLKETPIAGVQISETRKIAVSPKADNPRDTKLETDLKALAARNGYTVEFLTKTKTSVYGKSTTQLKENIGENKIQVKTRIAIIRRSE